MRPRFIVGVLFMLVMADQVPGRAGEKDSRLHDLTLEEKASLVTGRSSWETREVKRLGISAVWMADGPVGLRRSTGEAIDESVPATCFPSPAAMAATWNPALIERLGAAIGEEARANDVTLLLAPGLNLKRHPLGGRNFEYYSEDPLLSGRLAAAFVRGVQSRGVGATLKHFAVNNQEYRRMLIDARVSAVPLHELYLRGFEIAVREGQPQAVMSAYNRVNGVHASENSFLLSEMLRGRWGFDGLVVSDWGAVDEPEAAIAAGLDLEMPGNPLTPAKVVAAVREGRLDEEDLDRAVSKVLQLVDRRAGWGPGKPDSDTNLATNHELAREVATESLVLLKNDGLLPLEGPPRRLGVVGRLAFEPRIQGVGSSQIVATEMDLPWDFLRQVGSDFGHTMAAWRGYSQESEITGGEERELEAFLSTQDALIVFAGQKASHDAEAWDRPSMSLAPADEKVVEIMRLSGKPFVVVLVGGGGMDVRSFHDEAGALLMGWLGGQGFGQAVARVIYGQASPSGKLSETFAWSAEHHPSSLNFPGGPKSVHYGEGLFVGYRYFQSSDREVAFPFGHGLSYGQFEYFAADAPLQVKSLTEAVVVTVEVRNTGRRAGAETVQVYLRRLTTGSGRPDRELVGFHKAVIEPGAAREFSIAIEPERFAVFDADRAKAGEWVIKPGDYEFLIGASAADIRASLPLRLTAGTAPPVVLTLSHTVGEIYDNERGRAVIDFMQRLRGRPTLAEAEEGDFMAAITRGLPFKKLSAFSNGATTVQDLENLLRLINSDMEPARVTGLLWQMMSQKAAQQKPTQQQPAKQKPDSRR